MPWNEWIKLLWLKKIQIERMFLVRHCFSFRFVQTFIHHHHFHRTHLSSSTKKKVIMSSTKRTSQPSIASVSSSCIIPFKDSFSHVNLSLPKKDSSSPRPPIKFVIWLPTHHHHWYDHLSSVVNKEDEVKSSPSSDSNDTSPVISRTKRAKTRLLSADQSDSTKEENQVKSTSSPSKSNKQIKIKNEQSPSELIVLPPPTTTTPTSVEQKR